MIWRRRVEVPAGDWAPAVAPVGVVYACLFLEEPTRSTVGVEPRGNGYLRVAVPNGSGAFAWRGKTIINRVPIRWPAPTPGGWGDPRWFGFFDSPVGGDLLMWGRRGPPTLVHAGVAPRLEAGEVIIHLEVL